MPPIDQRVCRDAPSILPRPDGIGSRDAELRRAARRGRERRDRHGRRRLHRHAGAADGQAPPRPSSSSSEMDAGHGVEGCNYLLALEMEMDPVPGYALASWEQGYGDFDVRPDLATLRRIPWLEATALVLGDVQWHDGTPVQPSPRQVLKAQLERAAALGFTPMMGSELEFYLLRETFEEAHEKEYSGPDAVGAVHPRLPHPRDDLRRGLPAPDPERDAGGRHAGRDVEGRGVAGPAGDQLPLRRRADDGGQPRRSTRTAPRRSRSSTGARSRSWRSRSRTGSATPATSTRRSGATASRASRATRRCSRAGSPGRSRASRSSRSSLRRRSTPTSGSRPARGRRRRSRGERQPHLRLPRRRPRRRPPGRDADPRRRREPVPRVRGRDRGGPARDRERARAAARRSRETPTSRTPSGSRRRCARRSPRSRTGTMARGGVRRPGRRPLPQLRAHRAGGCTTPSSPTGSASATSSAGES